MRIKPKSTRYNGYFFRSRLEARWAVFFDAVNIKYTYEPEGFDLSSGSYLPDFHLIDSNWNCYVEIKPNPLSYDDWHSREWENITPEQNRAARLCHELSVAVNRPVLFLGGYPGVKETKNSYRPNRPAYKPTYSIAVFLPDMILSIPSKVNSGHGISFPVMSRDYFLGEDEFCHSHRLFGFIRQQYTEHPEWFTEPLPSRGDAIGLMKADRIYFQNTYGREHPRWKYGLHGKDRVFAVSSDKKVRIGYFSEYMAMDKCTADALMGAQQARFEFGQVGAPENWSR